MPLSSESGAYVVVDESSAEVRSGWQGFPAFVSVVVAAKSFVLSRCSNFIFSRPHDLFRGLRR
jgi:hypothetical protein